MKKWRLISLIITFSLLLQITAFAGDYRGDFYIEYGGRTYQYTSKTVSIVINGHSVETGDMPAIIIDSRTLVPAREVFESEALAATVTWNGDTQEVSIIYKDKFIVLKIGSNVAYVNNQAIDLDVPAMLIKEVGQAYSKTMIPLRFVTESFGYDVEWDGDTWTAYASDGTSVIDGSTDMDTEGEKLDSISGAKAETGLPTALFSSPINIKPEVITNPIEIEPVGLVMTDQDLETALFTDIAYHGTNSGGYFELTADGPISSITKSYWDNKLIIKIANASFGYNSTGGTYTKAFTNNPYVAQIRSSQQENDDYGRKILSVIFDLKDAENNYQVRISSDRNSLYIGKTGQMEQVEIDNALSGVKLHQNDIGDYIDISYGSETEVNVFRLSGPDRIVFDLKDTITTLGTRGYSGIEGQYVTAIRTAQFGIDDPGNDEQNENIARIVVETNGQADYELIELDEYTLRIQLKEPGYENISYENLDGPTIVLEDISNVLEVGGITYEDNYRDHEYIITIPGSYNDNFGEGILNINDGLIESVDIYEDELGNTKIKIIEKEIYVFTLDMVGDDITIKAYKPSEVYSKVIVVDTGHGGKDPGAGVGSWEEKVLNLQMTMHLKNLLDQDGQIKVYYTRLDDTYLTLQDRCDIANQVEADFFISIHNNSFVTSSNGTETLFFQDDPKPALNGYELADIIHNKVIDQTAQFNRGTKKNNTLYVLRHTEMPAVLVECGFMTNTADLARLIDPAFQLKFAEAVYNGILETYQLYPTDRTPVIDFPIVAE
ncbi:MAG: N-acetylmuramoyl-L-alanine amidase [Vallitaleaceae bacterium]|jgi:N-acetylmuramoyl-L-alanine amidase|nr:N-acetylmuramoyl-L-alanine amidase [Vallitaleaceae bacterium]